jgi:hypothetical protein
MAKRRDIIEKERPTGIHYIRHPFVRIRFPASEAKELLKILYWFNVSPDTLMPSLSTAACEIKYKKALG